MFLSVNCAKISLVCLKVSNTDPVDNPHMNRSYKERSALKRRIFSLKNTGQDQEEGKTLPHLVYTK